MKNYIYIPVLGIFMISCHEHVEKTKAPNIIYILADDLGYAELGCYGQEKIETPNIDKLAERGMRFMQNYSGSPVSAPSRCVTFTGLHSGHAYIRGNDEMPERGAVGDHHAMLDKEADMYNKESYEKYTKKVYSCDPMYDELLKFVEKNRDTTFFLTWTTPLPHVPLQAPEKWVKHYVDKFGEEEPYIGKQGYFPCRYPRATYAAMISYWDEQIGGLIDKLKELGIYENTVIMFTSDNGPTFNGGSDSPWFDSAKPFRSEYGWGKCFLREGSIRVPLIVTWEGRIKGNTVSDHISASWDMMPTVCELAGINSPKTDGISIVPELLGKEQPSHDFLYWEFPEGQGMKAIRMGNWKGLILNIKKEGESNFLLYDLEKDPNEQTNVASQYPEIVEQMRQKMKEAHEDSPVERFRM